MKIGSFETIFDASHFKTGEIPVFQISRSGFPSMHRFFDSSPISPSGALAAYTEFHFDDRLPSPGDAADVVVVSLINGKEVFRSSTTAWDTQLGAQVQWGSTDQELLFNRMDESCWRAYGVIVDPTGLNSERKLDGQIYAVSPDGSFAASCQLESLTYVQAGYGTVVPKERIRPNVSAPSDDGVWLTNLRDGGRALLLSYSEIIERAPSLLRGLDLSKGAFYGFHVKWSPDGSRIMLLLRWLPSGGKRTRNSLLTFTRTGGDLRIAVHPSEWGFGHHPNWCPDGRIIMNISVPNTSVHFPLLDRIFSRSLGLVGIRRSTRAYDLRLGTFGLDGEDRRIISPNAFGSGHPTLHVSGKFALTDAYPNERVSTGDGTVPIRVFEMGDGRVSTIFSVPVVPRFLGKSKEWRVDPHPTWDRSGSFLVFNAAHKGERRVYLADMRRFVSSL